MSDTGTETPRADDHHGLRRSLGFRDLVVYGLLFIAPMAPVGVFGTLDARSHGAVALVYLVAAVAMAFTAFSYAQMVRVVPQAGSVFAYARVALGNGAGFVAGWMAMLDCLLSRRSPTCSPGSRWRRWFRRSRGGCGRRSRSSSPPC